MCERPATGDATLHENCAACRLDAQHDMCGGRVEAIAYHDARLGERVRVLNAVDLGADLAAAREARIDEMKSIGGAADVGACALEGEDVPAERRAPCHTDLANVFACPVVERRTCHA